MYYEMTLKDGSIWILDAEGNILRDGTRGMTFAPDGSWRILGFTTRHNGRAIISLRDAANGADLGQGWVHDCDHGTRRMWGMPRSRRAVSIQRRGFKPA